MIFKVRYILLLITLSVITPSFLKGQELIRNGDFEKFSYYPKKPGNPGTPYFPCNDWVWPPVFDSTYGGGRISFSHADSLPLIKMAHSGKVCALLDMAKGSSNHLLANGKPSFTHRNYLYTKLVDPLIPGNKYTIRFYIRKHQYIDWTTLCINCIEVLFSTEVKVRPRYISSSPLPIFKKAQIKYDSLVDTVWTKIQQTFIADSAYQYLTVGNFKQDSVLNLIRLDSGYISASPYLNGNTYAFDDFSVLPAWLYITGDSSICYGDSTSLRSYNHNGFTKWVQADNPSVVISEDSIVTVKPEVTTKYIVYSSVDTADFTVRVKHYSVEIGNDTTICSGEQIALNPFLPGADFVWSDGSRGDSLIITKEGIYSVDALIDGCTVSDSLSLFEKYCHCNVTIPNAFTPNYDGLNESFNVNFGCSVKFFSLRIYNRWGFKVYETQTTNLPWGGIVNNKPAPTGIYTYTLEYVLSNGDRNAIKGKVLIMR